MPVAVDSLEPEVAAPTTIADYLEDRDSGLVAALGVTKACGRGAQADSCRAETRDLAGPAPASQGKAA